MELMGEPISPSLVGVRTVGLTRVGGTVLSLVSDGTADSDVVVSDEATTSDVVVVDESCVSSDDVKLEAGPLMVRVSCAVKEIVDVIDGVVSESEEATSAPELSLSWSGHPDLLQGSTVQQPAKPLEAQVQYWNPEGQARELLLMMHHLSYFVYWGVQLRNNVFKERRKKWMMLYLART